MPTQSISLGTVTDATFNGSAVEQVNLNGAGVWTKPVSGMQFQVRQPQPAIYDGSILTHTSATPWATVPDDIVVYDAFGLSFTCGFVNHQGKAYIGWGNPNTSTGAPDPLPSALASAGMSFPFSTPHPSMLQEINHGQYRNRSDWRNWYPIAEITPTGFVKAYTGPNNVAFSVFDYIDSYGNNTYLYFRVDFSTTVVNGKCFRAIGQNTANAAAAYDDTLNHNGSGLYWSKRTVRSNTALADMPTNFNNNFEAVGSTGSTTLRLI